MWHHYVSDFASVLIRKGMSFRNLAVGLHETIKFMRKVLFWRSCLNLYLSQMTTSQHTEHQSFNEEQNQVALKVGLLFTFRTTKSATTPNRISPTRPNPIYRFVSSGTRACSGYYFSELFPKYTALTAVHTEGSFDQQSPGCVFLYHVQDSRYSLIYNNRVHMAECRSSSLNSEEVSGTKPSLHSSPNCSVQSPGRQAIAHEILQRLSIVHKVGKSVFSFWVSYYAGLIDNEATNGSTKEAVLDEGLQPVLSQTMSAHFFPFHLTQLARRNSQYR